MARMIRMWRATFALTATSPSASPDSAAWPRCPPWRRSTSRASSYPCPRPRASSRGRPPISFRITDFRHYALPLRCRLFNLHCYNLGLCRVSNTYKNPYALIKKENQIFLIYKEIQNGPFAKSYTWLTAASYMGQYLRISSYIRRPFLIYDFATAPLWIPYIWGIFYFLFYISVGHSFICPIEICVT